ncbi:pyridoxamine 5'-phosphate oxidase family protein [Streptomyces sp. NBC_01476]|uniref:pyridoxine/pyridoxamine 5'-phosphate oxidase n=1 Tax=Streptomyces sp. NBC_01476 TaxID=2903881 RepID=UPI002E30E339|nr:pyridoxamine 5'-phosphate oxidase family protein [Streptomyces sp. NBC_01476]
MGDGDRTGGGTGPVDDAELLARLRAAPVLAGPLPEFDPGQAPGTPGPLFAQWLDRALADGVPEPGVVTLSTAGADGTPSARVLMLRGIDTSDCAFDFASDSRSPKGLDLAVNPVAALTWYWPAHGRQIRLAGPVSVRGPEDTRRDFLGRSETARAAALVGRVSAPLRDAGEYERAMRVAREQVAAEPERVPATHALYRLRAREAEFWQGNPVPFHLRLRYERDGDGWTRNLLWP